MSQTVPAATRRDTRVSLLPSPEATPAGLPVDLLVVGGGVHGCAIARDAATRGLSVALLEKHDFGWATSSRSSKLAHGGLRYLEHLQFGMVRESLRERDALLNVAPHLSWPLPFLIPLSGPVPRAGWKVRVGLQVYDLLAGKNSLAPYRILRRLAALKRAPVVEGSGLRHAAEYHDAGMDDLRIVIELLVDAMSQGARCLNGAEVTSLIRGPKNEVQGARFKDEDGTPRELRARMTVLSAGPWTDELAPELTTGPRLLLSKGVHLFFRRKCVRDAALFLAAPSDGRVFFLIPWKAGTLVGTTETVHSGTADAVAPDDEDVRYLIDAVNGLLPRAELRREEVVAVQAGLRPLVREGSSPDEPGSVSRDYELDTDTPGLVVVEGGKYTIFRRLAERVVDLACDRLTEADDGRAPLNPCTTLQRPFPGYLQRMGEDREKLAEMLGAAGIAEASRDHLLALYGSRAAQVLACAAGDPSLLRPCCDEHPHLQAEAIHAMKHEQARSPADALLRRLDLPWWPAGGPSCRSAWNSAFMVAGLSEPDAKAGLETAARQLEEQWRA